MNSLWGAVQPKFDIYGAVKGFEGYTPRASWDYKQHSIGYGTRAKYPGEVIDRNEAENRLRSEVDSARRIVDGFAPHAPEGVKAALTSLTFNAGSKWTESGLGQAVKAGDWNTAQNRFLQYNKAGGSVLPGLVKRRQQEASWFNGAAPSIGAAPVASNSPPAPSQRMSLGGPMPAKQQTQTESPSWWGDINSRLQNPLFLGGLGMLVAANQGQDAASALNSGLRTGAGLQDQMMQNSERQRERAKQQALEEFWNSYDPSQLPAGVAGVLPGLSASQKAELVLQNATGQLPTAEDAALKRAKVKAETEKLQREASGANKYGRQGSIFQDPKTGQFFSVQFSETGERLIEPLQGLTPSRGVGEVDTGTGTQIIDKATGMPVREVGKNLRGAEAEKAIGKQQGENLANQPKAFSALQSANAKTDIVIGAIRDARKLTSGWSVGAGSLLASLPGTQARDLRARADTILANLGFEELQDMRNNSPTGGALGAIAVQELQMLQATKASLDQAQTVGQYLQALDQLESFMAGSRQRRQAAYEMTYGTPQNFTGGAAASGAPQSLQRFQKYGIEE